MSFERGAVAVNFINVDVVLLDVAVLGGAVFFFFLFFFFIKCNGDVVLKDGAMVLGALKNNVVVFIDL